MTERTFIQAVAPSPIFYTHSWLRPVPSEKTFCIFFDGDRHFWQKVPFFHSRWNWKNVTSFIFLVCEKHVFIPDDTRISKTTVTIVFLETFQKKLKKVFFASSWRLDILSSQLRQWLSVRGYRDWRMWARCWRTEAYNGFSEVLSIVRMRESVATRETRRSSSRPSIALDTQQRSEGLSSRSSISYRTTCSKECSGCPRKAFPHFTTS